MAIASQPFYTGAMITYNDTDIERLIDKAIDRAEQRLDKRFKVSEKRQDDRSSGFEKRQDGRFKTFERQQDKRFAGFEKRQDEKFKRQNKKLERLVQEAAERGAGAYAEATKDDIKLTLEAIDAIKVQVDKIPGMEEDMADLKSDMQVVKRALTDTNKDLHRFDTPGWFPGKKY
jgi:hypothetical protein